jgi:argininosuccinate lyase
VSLSLPHVRFDAQRGKQALTDGFTQATDLAEALVRRGAPFREAYKAVGALVAMAVDDGVPLRAIDATRAKALHPLLDADALRALDPETAVAAKESLGGTGPLSVKAQVAWLGKRSRTLLAKAEAHGTLELLAARVFAERLETE